MARGLAPRMGPLPRRPVIVAALDIGTSKIACLIARLTPRSGGDVMRGRTHSIELIGFGHTSSRGIKGGAVADMARAEESIRRAVDAAEHMARLEIASVLVSVSGGRLGSESFAASVRLQGASADQGDIGGVLDAASLHSVRDGRAVLHSLPVGYGLDGSAHIRDPRGMIGQVLAVDLHVVTADWPALKNLVFLVERCHLSVEGLVAAPYAAALSSLTADEAELGAICIDFGAGTTTASVFAGGDCVHTDGIAIGGQHLTLDLARALSARVSEAERLKSLYGNVIVTASDDLDMVTVPAIEGDRELPTAVPRSQIVRTLRPRIEEIVEFLRERLGAAGMLGDARRRLVLTGGGAQLTGLSEYVGRAFGATARIGRPIGIGRLSDSGRTPGFAAAAGLLIFPQVADREHFEPRRRAVTNEGNYLKRVGSWLKESF
ncbi:MAG TPA: cell division protein FtsA [Xanthobacteraceae bacterium]